MSEQTDYDAGDDVFVIDTAFEPVVQRGTVASELASYDTIPVVFDSDPYDQSKDDRRRVDVLPLQTVHADADVDEIRDLLSGDF